MALATSDDVIDYCRRPLGHRGYGYGGQLAVGELGLTDLPIRVEVSNLARRKGVLL